MRKNWMTEENCVACGAWTENGNCLHHILTRGAFREFQNEPWNKIPTCKLCHINHDSKGISEMARRYKSVEAWLTRHGWKVINGSWVPPVWR